MSNRLMQERNEQRSTYHSWSMKKRIRKKAIFSRRPTRTKCLVITRRASEATLFALGFPRKTKTLHNGSYEHRVPKIKNKTLFCTRDVWFNIAIGHLGPSYSTHTALMSVLTGSVHAHILTKPSRAGFAVSRLELIEPGAGTCVYWHGWAAFKKLGTCVRTTYQVQVPVKYTMTFLFIIIPRVTYQIMGDRSWTSCGWFRITYLAVAGIIFSAYHTWSIRESDRHDLRYMCIPSYALPIYKTTCDAKP